MRFRKEGFPVSRPGITILEVLVVMGILSLLMAILLPAVQSSRESARKMTCLSNLRQIGIATHNYLDAQQVFPYYGPLVALLPYVEEQAAYDQYTGITTGKPEKIDVPSVYRCPSDPLVDVNWHHVSYLECVGTHHNPVDPVFFHDGIGTTHTQRPFPDPFRGITGWPGRRTRDVTDGLSNTAYFSERLIQPFPLPTSFAADFHDKRYVADLPRVFLLPDQERNFVDLCGTSPVFPGANNINVGVGYAGGYAHLLRPNSHTCNNGNKHEGHAYDTPFTATSEHPGGVHVLLGDGSARFVSGTIGLETWWALGTRNGSDQVGEF